MTQGRHLQADSGRHLAALGHSHLSSKVKVIFVVFGSAIAPAHPPSYKEGVPPGENK